MAHDVILVVEDDVALRELIVDMLESLGCRVIRAFDGQSALEILNKHPIALLITDLVMPGDLQGNDLARTARSIQPGLQIVLMTGYGGDEIQARLKNEVEPDWIIVSKPFSKDRLTEIVKDCLT